MIDTIDYEFIDGKNKPYIKIRMKVVNNCWTIDDPYLLNSELNQLNSKYIEQIVKELEELQSGERERVDFWFELTIINVVKEWYKAPNWNFYPEGKVRISYDYWEKTIETSLTIDDILKMMTDYRDYVNAWEQETWNVKK